MNKYMLAFWNAIPSEESFAQLSPEAIQVEIEKWNNWIGGIAAQGKMVATEALHNTGKTVSGSANIVTDGPFTEGKEIIGGFMILTADSLEEAVELSNGCPIYDSEGRVEVRQIQVFN
ncbi:YciI family protein [Runella salmonicolor]|uniref:YciI family protein n=1 Tax=Runella salmonicolor TaxID=2950278 RepID=A0ABT1FP51_9BACT|nr:YciI family protein [Runella salmonicolor]MCP1383554.1 YciI family protein [Runella salmonicolor]